MRLNRLPYLPSKYKHYLISFLIQIVLAGFFIHHWDGFVFITSAKQFLQGITPYETALKAPLYTFCGDIQMWYAYPPLPLLLFSSSYAVYFYLLGQNLILERIFLKLVFILGNLLCAFLVYKLVGGASSARNAAKAEKLVLYNPFLIFIAAVWGMFDIWMVNFLLLSLLSLRQDRFGRAGVYFGLSVLVKPIPAILAPLLLAYTWNKAKNLTRPIVFGSAAIITFILISLPFFLSCPQGFVDQVLGMHGERPPFGWAPLQLFYIGHLLGAARAISLPSLSAATISAVSFALLAITTFTIFLYYWLKKEGEEKKMLPLLFLAILTFTLFSKGVSPQHFVIPLVLAIILLLSFGDYSLIERGDIKRYYKFLVLPYLLASILEGRHYFMFIPPDIARPLIGKSAAELDLQIASNFPISPDFYYAIPQVIHVLLIAPAVIIAGIMVYKSLRQIFPGISCEVMAYSTKRSQEIRAKALEKPLTVFMASLLVILPALAGAVSYRNGSKEPSAPPQLSFNQGDRLIGIFYYYWWHNPSFDPQLRSGCWLKTELTPKEGYYWSTYAYMKQDIQQIEQADIDFAILSFHDYYIERYITFARASEEAGFYFAPVIELGDLGHHAKYLAQNPQGLPNNRHYLSLTTQTEEKVINLIDVALKLKDSPAFLIYQMKPVVFLNGSLHFSPGWSEEEIHYLAQSVLGFYCQEYDCEPNIALEKISQNWGAKIADIADMKRYYPQSPDAFHSPQNKIEQDWSAGFKYTKAQFWGEIQAEVEEQNGDIFWVGDCTSERGEIGGDAVETSLQLFDATFMPSSSPACSYAADKTLNSWENQTRFLFDSSSRHHAATIATTIPYYNNRKVNPEGRGEVPLRIDGELSYDLLWRIALQHNPNIVLIASWNNYYENSCIEPTIEFDELFLHRTKYWATKFKTLPKV